jgi:hypothetical protein
MKEPVQEKLFCQRENIQQAGKQSLADVKETSLLMAPITFSGCGAWTVLKGFNSS